MQKMMKKTKLDVSNSATVPTHQTRKLLQRIPMDDGVGPGAMDSSPGPIFQPMNITTVKRSFKQQSSTSPFDSSMALTILVLLTALFFMGFFSIYIRRYADDDSSSAATRRRRPSSLPPPTGLYGGRKDKGLDASTVRSLPLVSYGGDAKQLVFADCPICLSEFQKGQIVKIIPRCGHVFHPKCVDTWLDSHVSCPLCRSTKFFKDTDDEVCLDVKAEQGSNGGGEVGGRSTADDADTWREIGMRRICSWTSLGEHVVLQRSMSF